MAGSLTLKQKKELARTLFVSAGLTQKDIAVKVGVTENTLTKWKHDEDWQGLRAVTTISRPAQLRMFYNQISEINSNIDSREEGKRYPTPSEGDTLIKISKAIKNLETEMGIAEAVNFSIGFLTWLRSVDPVKAQLATELMDGYIKDLQSRS